MRNVIRYAYAHPNLTLIATLIAVCLVVAIGAHFGGK